MHDVAVLLTRIILRAAARDNAVRSCLNWQNEYFRPSRPRLKAERWQHRRWWTQLRRRDRQAQKSAAGYHSYVVLFVAVVGVALRMTERGGRF